MNQDKHLTIIREWKQEDSQFVRKKLSQFNAKHVTDEYKVSYENVGLYVKNEDGEILGGIVGSIYWGFLKVDFFWLDEQIRGLGLGSSLLQEVEKLAREKECTLIKLDTFSFQAPEFYKKHGFEVIGTIEDAPIGHTQYFLTKRL